MRVIVRAGRVDWASRRRRPRPRDGRSASVVGMSRSQDVAPPGRGCFATTSPMRPPHRPAADPRATVRSPGHGPPRLVARRSQVEHDPVGPGGLGEQVDEDRPPGRLEAVHADEPRADVEAVGRDAIGGPEQAPQRGADDEAAKGAPDPDTAQTARRRTLGYWARRHVDRGRRHPRSHVSSDLRRVDGRTRSRRKASAGRSSHASASKIGSASG
jgi:hypothetical protein